MTDLRGELDFASEAFRPERHAEVRKKHLDRDLAIVLQILREVHGRHAPAAQLAHDLVPPFEAVCSRSRPFVANAVPCVKRR